MNKHVLEVAPSKLNTNINCDLWDFRRASELNDRRVYNYGENTALDSEDSFYTDTSIASFIVEQIIDCNRIDEGKDPAEREPIRLYINSPGGDVTEGFALISAMELSKTPIHTINMGQWSSMAFLIGIAGHKRFSLPKASFLMHDGSIFLYGSANKVKDRIEFENRVEDEVVKPFVLEHSKMSEEEYDKLDRKEFYMLAKDALKYGFIDEVITELDAIF